MPRTLDEAIRDANAKGIAIHNLFQLPDGSWRACLKVFGATLDLAQNPIYLNYADGDDAAECVDRALASSDKIKWQAKAAEGLAAMADKSCTATLIAEDRPRIKAAREGHHNRPTTKDAPPKPAPRKESALEKAEREIAERARESVEKSRRKTLEERLGDLL